MTSTGKIALAVLLPVFLQACAIHLEKVNSLGEQLEQSTPEATLQSLESISPPERDRAQYLLNSGVLKSVSGEFVSANTDLQNAKEIMNALQATSVSENFGAAIINETLRSYVGSPSERVLLHVLMSINYLMLNDLDAARVEVLQADVLMKSLAREDKPIGQLASAHYIAGLVYELGGEIDSAMISYRKALKIMDLRNMWPPQALKASLLDLSQRLGLDAEHAEYREAFNLSVEAPARDSAEMIIIYWDGVVTSKRGRSTSVWVPSLNQAVSLSLPYYPPSNYINRPFDLNISGRYHSTEIFEDIETLSREDLADEAAALHSMALARMVSKYALVKGASQQNSNLGLFMNLAAVLTESADIRSWNMLPSSMQVTRFPLAAGRYPLPYPHYSTSPQGELTETRLVVSPGEKIVLFVPGISRKVYSPQALTAGAVIEASRTIE